MAYDCNGAGARLTCDGVSSLNVGTGDFAFTCRVNSRNVTGAQKGFVQTSTTSGGLSTSYATGIIGVFGANASGSLLTGGLAFNVANVLIGSNTPIVNTNTEYLVSCIRSAGSVSVYVDSTLHTSGTASGNVTGQNICIGGGYDTSYTLVGVISEVAFWSAALTDAEILSLARGFTPDQIRPQSLQFYAPLVRDLIDVRGGRTITNNNGATVATHPRIIK